MKRALKALITILCALALACSGTAVFAQSGADEAGGYTDAVSAFADAEQSARAEKTETWELFLPSSSEQFLPLTSPNDVAFGDNYIAVADGNVIYVYDRAAGRYNSYTGTAGDTYSSLCFYGEFLLFVPNGSSAFSIRYIDCSAAESGVYTSTNTLNDQNTEAVTCTQFILNGDTLYYARFLGNTVNVYSGTISSAGGSLAANTSGTALGGETLSDISINPYFSNYGGTTYLSAQKTIYTVGTSVTTAFTTDKDISCFAITGTDLYYTSSDSARPLYKKTLSGQQNDERLQAFSNISSIFPYNGALYFSVTGSNPAVRQFSLETESYTGYEIAQYSSGEKRLGQNTDSLSLYGGRLVIADPANARVLLADTMTQEVRPVTVEGFSGSFSVTAGEEDFLVTDGSSVALYGYDGQRVLSPDYTSFNGTVVDGTYSYGSYYLVSSTGATYRLTEEGIGANGQLSSAPAAIAADINGDIWALSASSGTAYRYTEENFLSQNGATETNPVLFGTGTLDILVDYEGTVYGLTEDSVLVGGATDARQLDLSSYVSYADDAAAVAFAFGFATDEAYILTDAGFLVQWSGGIASLDTIDENGAYSALTGALTDENGGADAYDDLLVTVSADAVLVSLDESALTAENYLPAAGYARAGEARVGVKVTDIADPDGGNTIGTLVALYEYLPGSGAQGSQHTYSLCLVLGEGAQPLASSEYYTDTADTADYAGYTTNAVGLYNLPLMRQSGDTAYLAYRLELAKNTRVTVLGTVSLPAPTTGGYGLDADYCFVSYSADGQTVYGFVPASYLNASPSSGITGSGSAEIAYRYLKEQQITLSEQEVLTVWGEADEDGNVYATYEYRGVTYGGKVALSLLGEENADGGTAVRPLLEESSVTLYNTERLTVYLDDTDDGLVRVNYTLNGKNYTAVIDESLLAEASDFGIWVLVAVTIVTAAVLASACYLVLRKPPVMEAPLPAEEDADGDGSPESGTDLPDETDGNTPPQDGGQSGR